MGEVGLKGLQYYLGTLCSVEGTGIDPTVVESLLEKGLRDFANAQERPAELARQAIQKTLVASGIAPAEVDALVYASTTFGNKADWSEAAIGKLLHELGLVNAVAIGSFFPGCANAVTAVRLAASLVMAQQYRRVLVVTVDKVLADEPQSRVMPPSVSILSDAAASVMVTSDGAWDWRLCAMDNYTDASMWNLDYEENYAAFLLATSKGTAEAARRLRIADGGSANAYRQLITNNYNVPVMEMLAKRSGFPAEQVFTANVPRFGHAYAADTLINLADHTAAGRGGRVMVLATGHKNWAGMVVDHSE